MDCKHKHRIGDNYGESCVDCGEQLRGYGYGGFFGINLDTNKKCIHLFSSIGDAEVCIYCEEWKAHVADE
jgi:hypothetical protein